MDFRQYDNAIGRFVSIDALAEINYSDSPYSFAYNNPVFWADPTGLFGEGNSWLENMWNKSSNNNSTIWNNTGTGGFTNGAVIEPANNDLQVNTATGEVVAFEKLSQVTIYSGNSSKFNVGIIQSHVYWTSKYYQGFRDRQFSGQVDDFQNVLDGFGMIPVLGEGFDLLNAGISALRGNYGTAALSLAAVLPFVGNGATAGKWTSKAVEYEKLADGIGTRAYIKEFNGTTAVNTKILFNDITQGGTKKIVRTSKGNIIHATMSDGSIIQLRNFSTKSGSSNHSTIEFLQQGQKWKFN